MLHVPGRVLVLIEAKFTSGNTSLSSTSPMTSVVRNRSREQAYSADIRRCRFLLGHCSNQRRPARSIRSCTVTSCS